LSQALDVAPSGALRHRLARSSAFDIRACLDDTHLGYYPHFGY